MAKRCVHSCKGVCNALELAERLERAAMDEYRRYADECDYPDVRALLLELVKQRERALTVLQQTREVLSAKFSVVDSINDSFL
jgi:rubrerythrin